MVASFDSQKSINGQNDLLHNIDNLSRLRDLFEERWTKFHEDDLASLYQVPDISCDKDKIADNIHLQFIESTIVDDISKPYWTAAIAKPIFEETLRKIVFNVGMNIRTDLILTALKSQRRAQSKADTRYGGKNFSRLWDIVRGSIICNSPNELLRVLDEIQTIQNESASSVLVKNTWRDVDDSGNGGNAQSSRQSLSSTRHTNEVDIEVVRIKNRCLQPTSYGYRDILINLRIQVSDDIYHICELQLHLRPMYEIYSKHRVHNLYEYFEPFFASSIVSWSDRHQQSEKLIGLLHLFNSKIKCDSDFEEFTNELLCSDDEISQIGFCYLATLIERHSDAELLQRHLLAKHLSESNHEDTEVVLKDLFKLASILEAKQHWNEAEELCSRVIRGRELLSAGSQSDCRHLLEASSKLANILIAQKKLEQGARLLHEATSRIERLYGLTHPNTMKTLQKLSDVLIELENYPEAERVLRKLVKSYEGANKGQTKDSGLISINTRNRCLPNLDDRLLTAKIALATVLKTNKSLVEARQLFEEVLLTKKKRNETCDTLTLRIVDALAEIHEALGCDAEAERCYTSNFQLRVRLYGEGHIATIVSLLAVANLCAKQKNFGRASECFHQAKGLLESHLGADDVKTKQAAKKAKKCLAEANRSIKVQSFDEARAHIMINVAGAGSGRQFIKSSRCEECNFQYTLLTREHHCRLCIRSVCHNCSPSVAVIPFTQQTTADLRRQRGSMSDNNSARNAIPVKVRVCNPCHFAINMYQSLKAGSNGKSANQWGTSQNNSNNPPASKAGFEAVSKRGSINTSADKENVALISN